MLFWKLWDNLNQKKKKLLSRGIKILINHLFLGYSSGRHFCTKDYSTRLKSFVFKPQGGLVQWLWDGQTLILKNESYMLNSNPPRVPPFRKFKQVGTPRKGQGKKIYWATSPQWRWAGELQRPRNFVEPVISHCLGCVWRGVGGWGGSPSDTAVHRQKGVGFKAVTRPRAARKFLRNLC